MNKVMLQGYPINKPELRHTKKGVPVTNFTLKTIETHRNKTTGEIQKNINRHDIVCWGNTAKRAVTVCDMNKLVLIEGELSTHTYSKGEGEGETIIKKTEVKANRIQSYNPKYNGNYRNDNSTNENSQQTEIDTVETATAV